MFGMGLGARQLFGSLRCAKVPVRQRCHHVLQWLLCPCPSPVLLLEEPKQKGFPWHVLPALVTLIFLHPR